MGQNNRARRAAKARSRDKSRARRSERGQYRSTAGGAPPFEQARAATPEQARQLLWMAATWREANEPFAPERTAELVHLPAALVDAETEHVLQQCVTTLWAGGWQPAELHRQSRLGCSTAAAARLVAVTIAVDHAGRGSATLDARWSAQIDGLDLPDVSGRPGWVAAWAQGEALDRAAAIEGIVDALANLGWLPSLDEILPPPGSSGVCANTPFLSADSDPVLARIRNLLAKAESTTFEAEATAFTAKAQDLMTRHAIDAAMVQSGSGGEADHPVSIRVPVDAPYVDAKSLLLQTVAEATRCRALMLPGLTMSTVVGFQDDLAAVELLFTSLLVQAQTALADAARRAPAGTRTRSQSYRSTFLLGFTRRIGERLREINDAVYADVEAERGSSFLPVLRSRADEIDDVMHERYGGTTRSRVRGGHDPAGWAGGTLAADNAQLATGDLAGQSRHGG